MSMRYACGIARRLNMLFEYGVCMRYCLSSQPSANGIRAMIVSLRVIFESPLCLTRVQL